MAESFSIIRYGDDREETVYGPHSVYTPHLASVLVDEGIFSGSEALSAALDRAFEVCMLAGIPIDHHFRRVYVHGTAGCELFDWAMSDLAWYLVLLNGAPADRRVAMAQVFALKAVLRH